MARRLGPVEDEHPMAVAYRTRLAAADRLDTPDGALVMALVHAFIATSNGPAKAALSLRIMTAADRALAGAEVETDALDDLKAKRRKRFGA